MSEKCPLCGETRTFKEKCGQEIIGVFCLRCRLPRHLWKRVRTALEAQHEQLERLRQAECPECGRSLPPDGDCYGCTYDRAQERILELEEAVRKRDADAQMHVGDFVAEQARLRRRIERLEAVVRVVRAWDVPSILRSPECMPYAKHWVNQVVKELEEALAGLDKRRSE